MVQWNSIDQALELIIKDSISFIDSVQFEIDRNSLMLAINWVTLNV